MQIKQQALSQHLQKKIAPIYVLIGQDNYLIEESLNSIKSTIKNTYAVDEKKIHIQATEDWELLVEEANSYSLFANNTLLSVIYDKKTIDAAGKKILTKYLTNVNTGTYIIIQACNLQAKQMSWLANSEQVVLVVTYTLGPDAIKNWIVNQLKKHSLNVQPQVPELIYQYTQGNMLACAQVIEKISLNNPANSLIQIPQALEHLSDQCEYSLYELVDACLLGLSDKAIHILRQAAQNKTEPTLVLWVLAQEVRLLLQLSFLMQQKINIQTASSQLKIWPQKINLYQTSLKRLDLAVLKSALNQCQKIDEQIKSNGSGQVWNSFELVALTLSTGKNLSAAHEL